MSDIYPLVIVKDRYNGTYSGGKWTAWNLSYVPSKVDADDTVCIEFFSAVGITYGRGETPHEAIADLQFMIDYGKHIPTEHIKPVSESTESEEDEKMEPMSVWKIENIDDIWMSQEGNMMSLALKNKDDLTKIILTGDAIKKHNDNFHIILKYDMDAAKDAISSLKRENEELKKELHSLKLEKTNLPKTPITDTMLVDDYNRLVKENEELKEKMETLKPLLNNLYGNTARQFNEAKHNTRADILDQAKKCVCGQREQDYGTPESNFQLIADLWNDYLGFTSYALELEEYLMDLKDKGIDIDIDVPEPKAIFPEDVSMMMALLKIARIKNGGGSGDSFVDLAGYAACGGEIWADERKSKDQN